LAAFPGLAQTRWAAWIRKQRLTDLLPMQFGVVLDAVTAFTDPVVRGQSEGQRWDPTRPGWGARPLADS
jgi:hypothetical protein